VARPAIWTSEWRDLQSPPGFDPGDGSYDNLIVIPASLFADLADGTFEIFTNDRNDNMGTFGSNRALLTINTVPVVPEPQTGLLVGLGLIPLAIRARSAQRERGRTGRAQAILSRPAGGTPLMHRRFSLLAWGRRPSVDPTSRRLDADPGRCDTSAMLNRRLATITLASFAWLASVVLASPAHAYIDAGTGSMILQILVASAAAGLFILKSQWRRLKAKFFGSDAEPERAEHDPQASVDVGDHRDA
jgi:hypothetical protein